jgi:hypothetical protein
MAAPPTAVHAVGVAHDTALKPMPMATGAAGTAWTRHRRPSHRSASGTVRPALSTEAPTAMQAVPDPQDMAEMRPLGAVGAGICWADQIAARAARGAEKRATATTPRVRSWRSRTA